MHRWTSLVVGVLMAAAAVGALVWTGKPGHHARPAGSASASASAGAAPAPRPEASAGPVASGEEEDLMGLEPGEEWAGDGGRRLPPGAPTSVGFGVILFTYQGAQLAPPGARSKDAALQAAKAVIEDAKKDFTEAVKKGDKGSAADVGHIQRGVLEPDIETVLFGLEKGAVHPEPLDTPRGYWVVKRTD